MATVTFPDKALVGVLGPIKMEIIEVTDVSNEDTIQSKLESPQWAMVVANGDLGGVPNNISTEISGKTITLHNPSTITSFVVIVFGY